MIYSAWGGHNMFNIILNLIWILCSYTRNRAPICCMKPNILWCIMLNFISSHGAEMADSCNGMEALYYFLQALAIILVLKSVQSSELQAVNLHVLTNRLKIAHYLMLSIVFQTNEKLYLTQAIKNIYKGLWSYNIISYHIIMLI